MISTDKVLEFVMQHRLILVAITIVASWVIYMVAKRLIARSTSKLRGSNEHRRKKQQTYLKLFNSICRYAIIVIDAMIILSIYGVDVSSILAGLGVVSVIAGLALQDALKDIIAGFNIVIDDYYSVGDIVELEGIEGKIIDIGLKVTKLKDIKTNNVLVIANRNVSEAINISNEFDIDIPAPYEKKVEEIEAEIAKIVDKIVSTTNADDAVYKGVQEFGDSAIYYKVRIICKPDIKLQVRRDVNRIIKTHFDAAGISMPYPQLDIHQA